MAGVVLLSALISFCFVRAAMFNYPGGVAVQRLHDHLVTDAAARSWRDGSPVLRVHLDPYTCMNGVTRYVHEQATASVVRSLSTDSSSNQTLCEPLQTERLSTASKNTTSPSPPSIT